MLNVDNKVKTEFLRDSSAKELIVESGIPSEGRNFFSGISGYGVGLTIDPPLYGHVITLLDKDGNQTANFSDCADMENMRNFDYVCVQFIAHLTGFSGDESEVTFSFSLPVEGQGYNISTKQTVSISELTSSYVQITLPISTSGLGYSSTDLDLSKSNSSNTFSGTLSLSSIMLSFSNDISVFPNTYVPYYEDTNEYFKVTNDNLVSESFSLNESLCSEQNIKFGLCEAAYCQFTVADNEKDFKDRIIKPSIKLKDSTLEKAFLPQVNFYKESYPVPSLGSEYWQYYWNNLNLNTYFALAWQNKTLLMTNDYYSQFKFVCVTVKCKVEITNPAEPVSAFLFYPQIWVNRKDGTRRDVGRVWYDDMEYSKSENCVVSIGELSDWHEVRFYIPINFGDYYSKRYPTYADTTTLDNFQDTGFAMRPLNTDGDIFRSPVHVDRVDLYVKQWQINLVQSKYDSIPEYDPADCVEYNGSTIEDYLNCINTPIPLGVFKVNSVKKHHTWDMIKQEITAYDNLTVLEQNAADWYTQYMFGISFDDYTSSYGFQFARQMFSTFYNYLYSLKAFDGYKSVGEYAFAILWEESLTPGTDRSGTPKVLWALNNTTDYPRHTDCNINYISHTVTNPDISKLYFIHIDYPDYPNIDNIKSVFEYPQYEEFGYSNFDPLYRGLYKGNVLVEQTLSNGSTNNVCVDSEDYFMLDPDCIQVTVHVAVCIQGYIQGVYDPNYVWHAYTYVNSVYLGATNASLVPDLPNGAMRLVYYNYGNQDIFACDSSITGRDVVRSLLEINGCFFRLNRSTGKPEFVYCTKSGLYPRNDLYPADDLYPREGTNHTITMGQYQSFEQEDYTVQKYGKIQIRKNITSNETKSIVEWEYTGDDSYDNVYAIDDNIFYCNEDMEYDYDNMPEVSKMLANMWGRISNMDYTPCTLVCKGMPWIECGDRIGVLTKTGGAESFIFHRTLTGIQALKDTYESEGDEYTEAINDYGYKEWEGN